MAIIKSPKVLECLIPEPNDKFYMSKITHTPNDILNRSNIYGVMVNNTIHAVTSIFRVSFAILAATEKYYLFINNATKELESSTPYITAKTKVGIKPKLEEWDFRKDDIGLYASVGLFGDNKIYFTTSYLDAKEIRELIKKEVEKNTLITETVYV